VCVCVCVRARVCAYMCVHTSPPRLIGGYYVSMPLHHSFCYDMQRTLYRRKFEKPAIRTRMRTCKDNAAPTRMHVSARYNIPLEDTQIGYGWLLDRAEEEGGSCEGNVLILCTWLSGSVETFVANKTDIISENIIHSINFDKFREEYLFIFCKFNL